MSPYNPPNILLTSEDLPGVTNDIDIHRYFPAGIAEKAVRDVWLELYKRARMVSNQEDRCAFMFILANFVHRALFEDIPCKYTNIIQINI